VERARGSWGRTAGVSPEVDAAQPAPHHPPLIQGAIGPLPQQKGEGFIETKHRQGSIDKKHRQGSIDKKHRQGSIEKKHRQGSIEKKHRHWQGFDCFHFISIL
jgi:hypothetical protein